MRNVFERAVPTAKLVRARSTGQTAPKFQGRAAGSFCLKTNRFPLSPLRSTDHTFKIRQTTAEGVRAPRATYAGQTLLHWSPCQNKCPPSGNPEPGSRVPGNHSVYPGIGPPGDAQRLVKEGGVQFAARAVGRRDGQQPTDAKLRELHFHAAVCLWRQVSIDLQGVRGALVTSRVMYGARLFREDSRRSQALRSSALPPAARLVEKGPGLFIRRLQILRICIRRSNCPRKLSPHVGSRGQMHFRDAPRY